MPRIPANLSLAANPIPAPPTPQDTGADRAALAAAAPRMALIQGIGSLIGQAQGHVEEYVAQQRATEENSDLSVGLAEYKARLDKLDFEIERKRQSGTLGDLEQEYASGLARLDSDFQREWVEGLSSGGIKNVRWDSTRAELKARTTALRAGHGTAASLQILAAREQESAARFDLARRTAVSSGSTEAIAASYAAMRESNTMDPALLSQMEAIDRASAEANDIGRRMIGIQAASLDGYGLDDQEALSALETEIGDESRYPSLTPEQRDRAKLEVAQLRSDINKERDFTLSKLKEQRSLQRMAAEATFSQEFLASPETMTTNRARAIAAEAGDASLYSEFLTRMKDHSDIAAKAAEDAEKARKAKLTESEAAAKATLEKSQLGAFVDFDARVLRAATPAEKVDLFEEVQEATKAGSISPEQYNSLRSRLTTDLSDVQKQALGTALDELRGLARLDTTGKPTGGTLSKKGTLYARGADGQSEKIDTPTEWFAINNALWNFVQENPEAGLKEIREFAKEILEPQKQKVLEIKWDEDAASLIRQRAKIARNERKIEPAVEKWDSIRVNTDPRSSFYGAPIN